MIAGRDAAAASWSVERVRVSVAGGHGADLTAPPVSRRVRVHEFREPALVLGSSQPDATVDHAAARARGVSVVRRRSGGGAVLLVPGDVAWIDVIVPAGDPLWDADIGRAAWWLGAAWAGALGDVGVGGSTVHQGGLVRSRWSPLVCFAGLGAGEVTVAGRKVVGISQRRTRHAARFQVAALARWDPVGILALLALDPADRAAARADLADAAAGATADPDVLVGAFLARLPA